MSEEVKSREEIDAELEAARAAHVPYSPWPKVGDHCIAVDEHGVDHDALIVAVHSHPNYTHPGQGPLVNLVYVSDDPARTDNYGRQLDRHMSSVSHVGWPGCFGYHWRQPDEEKRGYTPSFER